MALFQNVKFPHLKPAIIANVVWLQKKPLETFVKEFTLVREIRHHCAHDCVVDFSIVENDQRRLAAQLERHLNMSEKTSFRGCR